jgi:cell division protein FtsQ
MMKLSKYIAFGKSRRAGFTVRAGAVMMLAATLVHGVQRGGQLSYEGSPWQKLPGKFASLIGLAADDIRINGLTHHDPEMVLQTLGVTPGGSLMSFDAGQARNVLQSMDWVSAASVQRKFPNRLEITIAERLPFAIWQHDSTYSLIDRAGFAMGGLELMGQSHLPLVTGAGANLQAEEIINHLEATPELKGKVSAVAMVGKRRWTLYLSNGVKIALPVDGVPEALAKISELDASQGLLSKGIREIDMRIPGQMTVAISEIEEPKAADKGKVKLSQK